jgi:hypothetical protein
MRQFLGGLLVVLAGCDVGGVDCDLSAFVSVAVEVVDLNGDAVPGAEVTYTIDGGATQQAECEGEPGDCTDFWTAFETEGEFVVTATFNREDPNDAACWFTDTAVATVTVTGNECHVDTQEVTLELDATQQVCA